MRFTLRKFIHAIVPFRRSKEFPGSSAYWERRYQSGGTSGAGSYGRLREYKARVINAFVSENQVSSVMEFGCGDGNQLALSQYPSYLGLDVSQHAVETCRSKYADDPTKQFFVCDPLEDITARPELSAQLVMSLDVIYHLVEDDIYDRYMRNLFASATRYVIIYSSNEDIQTAPHVRHHRFTDWVEREAPGWTLLRMAPNEFPFEEGSEDSSRADLYIYASPEESQSS